MSVCISCATEPASATSANDCQNNTHICPLVRVDDLQVRDVPADMVLVRARVPAQNVQHPARVLERLTAVVALDEADHLRSDLALVLEPSDLRSSTRQKRTPRHSTETPRPWRPTHLQAREQPKRDLRLRIDQLLLHELERRKRPLELRALERVLARAVYAVLERAHRAPRDAEPRVVQAAEGRAEALPVREERVVRDRDVVHEDRASERAAEGELVLDGRRGEAFHALLENEAADLVVPLAARPDDEDVTCIRDEEDEDEMLRRKGLTRQVHS